MFLNREAGFKITFLDGGDMLFFEPIPYESSPHDIWYKKEKWKELMNKVIEKWQADKTEIPTITL